MAIRGFDEDTFDATLYQYLSPSEPVDREELLHGRDQELENALDSLKTPGKHIFIYGDRGVGKSSLAQTAAYIYQSSDNQPIKVECEEDSSFYGIIEYIALEAIRSPSKAIEQTHKLTLSGKILSYEYTHKSTQNERLPTVDSMTDAVSLLEHVAALHSDKPIVIIDEFDTIGSYEEKKKFSTLIKHLSDKKIRLKFIFTGIAASLKELLGAHKSSPRQIGQIRLDKLSWDARFEIVDDVSRAFSLVMPDEIRFRIAGVSDGFPSYIHLITEKLLRGLFKKNENVSRITLDDYYDAIRDAINDVAETLRDPYERATKRDNDDYHHVLWALADAYDPERHFKNIYNSYIGICKELEVKPIERKVLSSRLASLKKDAFGQIVESVPNRVQWYRYKESMIRGFSRLIAEANGLTLNYEIYDLPVSNTVRAKQTISSFNYANKGLENNVRFRSERKYRLDHTEVLEVAGLEDD